MDNNNSLWIEKYRPTDLTKYLGNDHIKKKFKIYIETNDPPHILLYGKAGTGKTTLVKIISKNTDSDTMYLNASEESGIDIVRIKIKPFASSVPLAKIKLIILDEFDYMTPNSQAALRNLMEQFSKTTRFILTCNYHERIIEPIISRCQLFKVFPPSRKEVAIHVANILKNENISFIPEDLKVLVDYSYPDIRKLIILCQNNTENNKLIIDRGEIIDSDFKLKLLDILTKKDKKNIFKGVRQLVADNHVSDFTEIYKFLYDKVNQFAPNKIPHIITTIAEGVKYDVFVIDKEINFMDTIIKIISEL